MAAAPPKAGAPPAPSATAHAAPEGGTEAPKQPPATAPAAPVLPKHLAWAKGLGAGGVPSLLLAMRTPDPRLPRKHQDPVPSREALRRLFDHYDADKSGDLDEGELLALVEDMYRLALVEAQARGRSEGYVARVRANLETEHGRLVLAETAQQLLALRDANNDGALSWEEFTSEVEAQRTAWQRRHRFWVLAPLCDVEVDLDEFSEGPYDKLKLFAAGGLARAIAKTVGSPLSRVTVLMQTASESVANKGQGKAAGAGAASASASAGSSSGAYSTRGGAVALLRQIWAREGVAGLFRGNGADCLRSVPYGGLCYLSYEVFKHALLPHDTSPGGVVSRMAAGGLSGVLSLAVTYPLDLVRTRLVVQTDSPRRTKGSSSAAGPAGGQAGIWGALRSTVRHEGPLALFRGLPAASAGIFPGLALNFALFEGLRDWGVEQGWKGLPLSLGSGVVAGTVANGFTFPIDVVVRNMQIDGRGGAARRYRGAVHCARVLVAAHGWRGMYRGLAAQLVKAVPSGAASFAAYDALKGVLGVEAV